MKPVIGILATSSYMESNDTFKDTYRYGNNYIKKIVDNGGIPLLIPYVDNKVIYETLEMCDGLLLPGGSKVLESNFKVVDYFYENNKLVFITLEVRESNIPAISLYTQYGFSQVGKRKNYYSNPSEDALLLTKYFNS